MSAGPCFAGQIDAATCMKGMKDQWNVGKYTEGDGFSSAMRGMPDHALRARFKNGAELFHVSNHLAQAEPGFGVDKIAELFGFSLADVVGPGRYCLPRHRIQFDSRNES